MSPFFIHLKPCLLKNQALRMMAEFPSWAKVINTRWQFIEVSSPPPKNLKAILETR